jgi:DNA-binding protein H-NS
MQKPRGSALMVITQETAGCRKMQDPLNFLEKKKRHIQEQVRAGKLTQEEADARIARIEERIRDIREFNKLSVPEKKAKLLDRYRKMLEQKAAAGKITRQEADRRLQAFTEKVEAWDGQGYPDFGCRHGKKR